MPKRTVIINASETGERVAVLDQSGDIPEGTIEEELLAIIYRSDPALEVETGRLVPGMRKSDTSLSIHLTEPDPEGVSHIGEIRGKDPVFCLAIDELGKSGYEVEDGRL